jgi:hypothetical protein
VLSTHCFEKLFNQGQSTLYGLIRMPYISCWYHYTLDAKVDEWQSDWPWGLHTAWFCRRFWSARKAIARQKYLELTLRIQNWQFIHLLLPEYILVEISAFGSLFISLASLSRTYMTERHIGQLNYAIPNAFCTPFSFGSLRMRASRNPLKATPNWNRHNFERNVYT